jgi:hypothetical protein
MFARFSQSSIPKFLLLQQQQQRALHFKAEQRVWKQKYDSEITDKYPRVLEVIQGKLPKSALDTTERSALFVATYRTGIAGGKRIRQRERRLNFESKVDSLVKTWKNAEFLQRKENNRSDIIKRGRFSQLSSYKESINAPKHQMNFTVTRSEIP